MPKRELTRREFTKSMAVLAAALGMPDLEVPDLSADANAGGGVVAWAMIGTGARGTTLLRQLSKTQFGRCVALCDVYPVNLNKGLRTIGGNPAATDDYRRVLERKDVDAVLIATPLHLHAPMTLDALSAGKHVFVEKAMVFQEKEVKQVKEAAAANPKLVFQVGLQRRYSLLYRMAMEMIHKGALGKVTHIRAQCHRDSNWRRPVTDPKLERLINWRMYREYSGGLMAEQGSHQLDVASWALGAEPRSAVGFGGIDYWKDGRETYDNVQCLLEYPGGEKLIYSSITTNAHYGYSEQIMGDQGTLELTLEGPTGKGMFWREAKREVSLAEAKEQYGLTGATVTARALQKGVPLISDGEAPANQSLTRKEMRYARRWLAEKGWYEVSEPRDPVFVQLEHFLLCVRDVLKPVADVHVGAADSLAVIYSNRAMDENRRVYWPQYEPGSES